MAIKNEKGETLNADGSVRAKVVRLALDVRLADGFGGFMARNFGAALTDFLAGEPVPSKVDTTVGEWRFRIVAVRDSVTRKPVGVAVRAAHISDSENAIKASRLWFRAGDNRFVGGTQVKHDWGQITLLEVPTDPDSDVIGVSHYALIHMNADGSLQTEAYTSKSGDEG